MVDKNQKFLNPEQKKAVKHQNSPLLIIAGAGTGKTTVITERIKYLILSDFAKPEEILALTFTEKAAQEMEERVDVALPFGYTRMWISTFHSFCDKILRLEALHLGLNPAYKLLTQAESLLFLKKNLFLFNLEYFRPLGNPFKFINALLEHFNRLQDEDISSVDYLRWVENQKSILKNHEKKENLPKNKLIFKEELQKYQELANAFDKYSELKIKEGVMDFADLISNTLKLFRKRPSILEKYKKQFKFILVDEYQDTNIAQNELVKLLAGEGKNLTVVCDDDQAIYKWRGASISNVIQFKKSFPDAKLIVLNKNYRSTQEILDCAYDLIQYNNPDRLEVKEKINKKLISQRRIKGEKIEFIKVDRVENEADWVAQKIKELSSSSTESYLNTDLQGSPEKNLQGKENIKKDKSLLAQKHKYDFKDFAILVRANSQAEPFIRALSRWGIPYQFLGPGRLYRQPEIKDLIAYLKVLYNFEDNVSFYRLLSMKYFDLPARDIAVLLNYARKLNLSLFEACENIIKASSNIDPPSKRDDKNYVTSADLLNKDLAKSEYAYLQIEKLQKKTVEVLEKIIQMINRHLKLLSKESAGQILYYFLEDTGILNKMASAKSVEEDKEIQNISKFFNKLKNYEIENEDASVFAVVDWIDLSMEMGESPLAADLDWSENNAVNILTVHSAKGLQFKVVFLVNLVDKRFPTVEKKESIPLPEELIKEILPVGDSHLQEERRLFYVGITRACDLVYFTASDFYGEGKRERKISPFVFEALGNKVNLKTSLKNENFQLSLLEWKKSELVPLPKIKIPVNSLSFSQIETFKTCPLLYKYRYILKIPVPVSAAASFGESIHKTLYSLYLNLQQGKILTKEELFLELEKYWNPQGYQNRSHEEKMKKRGKEALEKFLSVTFNPKDRPLALEQRFSLLLNSSLKITGQIDRVDDLGGGKIEIIDYKTGKVPTQKEIDQNLQIAIYALAATSPWIYHKKPEEVALSFYFFETQEKITTKRNKKELEELQNKLLKIAKEIEESDFSPTPGLPCNYCDYKMICEAWK